MKENYNLVFGSPSDQEKILPGILRFTAENPGAVVRVHYASIDNTPDKAKQIMKLLVMPVEKVKQIAARREAMQLDTGWLGAVIHQDMTAAIDELQEAPRRAIISGAGMSNVLTGVSRNYARLNDLVIGVPIIDSATSGLSSILSTSEKPPLNPVLTVGLNNTYAALNIAQRFMQGSLVGREVVVADISDSYKEAVAKLAKELDGFGLKYQVKSPSDVGSDDLVISICDKNIMMPMMDRSLRKGRGVQIHINRNIPYGERASPYGYELQTTVATGMVGVNAYANAAMLAAQLSQSEHALNMIYAKKEKKAAELNAHRGLIVSKGEAKGA